MKQEFIEFLNLLMNASPEIVQAKMTPNIQAYIEALQDKQEEKPVLTDNGKQILLYMQQNSDKLLWKSRDIAEGLCVSSRGISGSFRKLVNDGFVEKMGEKPTIYSMTEKGKNFIIEN